MTQDPGGAPGRRRAQSINMHFECCNVYTRVHLNAQGTAFAGHCPKCATRVTIKASTRGSASKFWSAG